MAMTFTLVSHLREELSKLSRFKKEDSDRVEREMERLAIEVRLLRLEPSFWRSRLV